jgi:hypothetical protein
VDGLGMGHWLLVNLGFQKKWVELMGDPQVPQVTMAFNIQHMVQELDELGVPEKKKETSIWFTDVYGIYFTRKHGKLVSSCRFHQPTAVV